MDLNLFVIFCFFTTSVLLNQKHSSVHQWVNTENGSIYTVSIKNRDHFTFIITLIILNELFKYSQMSTRTDLQHYYRFWSLNVVNLRSYSDLKMCGDKLKLPGLWYTLYTRVTVNIESNFCYQTT